MLSPVRVIPALVLLLLVGYLVLTQANRPPDFESVSPPVAPLSTSPLPADVKTKIDKERATAEAVAITDEMIQNAIIRFDAGNATVRFDAGNATIPPSTTVVKDNTRTIRLVSDVFFAFDSAELNPAAIAKLTDIVAAIPKGTKVKVDGYTDSIGADAYNLTLSRQRGKAVADAMTGTRPDLKITHNGYGKSNPVAPNTNTDGSDNPGGRAMNRRVEIVYQS
ncbi:MAG: OmpA family protein [Azoarcus sp.]|jgi:outer membrane protein OmpA-like peptidoglycan-associated protein|nr:OmpA family protein [Azoarcus sp.]